MRIVDSATMQAWSAAVKGGQQRRPIVRATIAKLNIELFPYIRPAFEQSGPGSTGAKGVFSSAVFGQDFQPIELPNIASVKWQRSVDQDVASCTIELWNTERLAIGETPPDDVSFDKPGYMTYNRGLEAEGLARWPGYAANGWRDMLVPDRVIRTYEGYGFDPTLPPEQDTHMYPSGVWMIDDVEYTADGKITVTCRDIGRVLIDQIYYPPVVPFAEYGLPWDPVHSETSTHPVVSTSTAWRRPTYVTDSNVPYIGLGFHDGSIPYVDSNGGVLGHVGRYAFDTNLATYWLSVGNEAWWSSAFEFVQGRVGGTVHAVKLKPWGGPYKVYISLHDGTRWLGTSKIPYVHRVVDTNADIPYVESFTANKNVYTSHVLKRAYTGIQQIRITFTDLYDSGIGEFQYRAGLYDLQVNSSVSSSTYPTVTVGNFADYTDIVKWICAWGGFYWPDHTTTRDFLTESDGTSVDVTYDHPDPVLPSSPKPGRVWGDFEQTGTAAIAKLTPDLFDKKPLMDAISYIRDIFNFLFLIDETGGVVWRSPNIWRQGNFIGGGTNDPAVGRTTIGHTDDVLTIDETETLLGLRPKLSSRNIREKVFVANTDGKIGAVSPPVGKNPFNPYPSGLRRVAGWTDQHFATEQECQIMADLIQVRSYITYRTNTLQIPGNPAIQIDDQIKIMERVTGEVYLHYVKSISSNWDAATGVWTYDMETNWLGTTPFSNWAFDPSKLDPETQLYLRTIGLIP